jgi:DNA mismatch endonuclease, patch repair protein
MNIVDKKKRSWMMSRVKQKNTKPEVKVRSILHRLGYRFRINRKDLPGSPDIVLPKYETVIFVHGCFWHRHKKCSRATTPSTNKKYWNKKFEDNIARDKKKIRELKKLGWKVLIIWECETEKRDYLIEKLSRIGEFRQV